MVLKQVGPYTVSVSTNEDNWELVIDRSKYDCRGLQELYFTERRARYISIDAASSTLPNDIFEVSHLEVLSTLTSFEIDPVTTLLIPKEDVVSLAKYAKIVQTQNDSSQSCPMVQPNISQSQAASPKAAVSKKENQSTNDRNYSFTLLLSQPYMINGLQLYSSIGLSAWHIVGLQLSSDNKEWTKFNCFSMTTEEQTSRQPVMSLRFTGTSDAIELVEKYYIEGSGQQSKVQFSEC